MEVKEKHWSSELLTVFGLWLWEKGEYGHALMCIHGPQWGFKIGHQLKITWEDLLHDDDHEAKVKIAIETDEDDNYDRPIIGITRQSIELAYKAVEFEYWDDLIYKNYKTGRPLTTSTLNRELQKFATDFLKEMEEIIGAKLHLKPLKSNAFQIAWALKNLERYYYSKKCFVEISKFMGHRTLKDTIALLEVEPNDNIVFSFSEVFNDTQMNSDILSNKALLQYYMGYALNIN
ncbi:hypothetical protein [uncultured Algibacter sp.]|uniref:hypothetical protein n=1 Tax=uncultured Algibacter sp. TaxID=298659 RepID=UPI00262141BC|nr:hypothetical protein [uncultured Algibacter sp.]